MSLPCVKGGGTACRDGGIVNDIVGWVPHEEDDSGRAGKETSCGVPCEGESQRQVRG